MLKKLITFTGLLLFVGCSTKTISPHTITNLKKHNEVMKKVVKKLIYAKEHYTQTVTSIKPNSKVFFIDAHPDEKMRAKAMFNYVIALMNKKGICYEDKNEHIKKCAKPIVKITKSGEEADLVLSSLNGKMDKYDAYTAIYQFNKRYFPGFEILEPETTLKAFRTLTIYNTYLEDELYDKCRIDADLEKALKKKGCKIVDDPDEADYIIIYQTLACAETYIGHQPKSLLDIVAEKNIKTANNDKMEAYQYNGSMGLINGAIYGDTFSRAFKTYWTPTTASFAAIALFIPSYISYSGAAYEYVVIDNKLRILYDNEVEDKEDDRLADFVKYGSIRELAAKKITK